VVAVPRKRQEACSFEKKNQETSDCRDFALTREGSAHTRKSFLLLFFKKEDPFF
jgi:hypothetical protein